MTTSSICSALVAAPYLAGRRRLHVALIVSPIQASLIRGALCSTERPAATWEARSTLLAGLLLWNDSDRGQLYATSKANLEPVMKALNLITHCLVIIGGLNWGLVGIADFNLVAAIFGNDSALSNLIYILVGISALWQLVPFVQAISSDEPDALRGKPLRR